MADPIDISDLPAPPSGSGPDISDLPVPPSVAPSSGTTTDPGDPDGLTQQGISAAQATGVVPGVEEGAKQFWAGIKQLGAAISDTAQNFWKPEGNTPAERAANWDKRQRAVTSEENQRAAQQAAADQSAGVDMTARNVVAGAAQALPWLASGDILAPMLPAAAEAGYFGNITKQAALGAMQQATSFSPSPSKLSDIAVGTAAQTLFPAVASALSAGKNFVANKIQKALQDGRTEDAFQAAKAVLGDQWADGVSLAKRTGIPWLASMEAASNDTKLVENYAKASDSTVASAAQALRQDIPAGQGVDGAFASVKAAAQSALDTSRATRESLWNNGMAAFKNAAGDANLNLPEFGAKIKQLSADNNNLLLNPGKYNISPGAEAAINDFKKAIYPSIDPAVAKADAQLQSLIDQTQNPATKAALSKQLSTGGGPPNPQIKLADASDALTGLRKMQADPDPKVSALAGQLRDSFEADLDAATKGGDPTALKALSDLKQMRAEYGRQAQLEDTMKASAVFKLTGVGQGLDQSLQPTTEDMWNGFKNLTPARQAGAVDFMATNKPDALVALKQKSIDEAVSGASIIGSARDSQQSLDKFAGLLFDKDQGMVPRNPGLWTDAEITKLEGVKAGISVIANTSPKGSAGQAPGLGAVVNYAYNKAPDIVAKGLMRLIAGGVGAEVFTNPKLMEAISTVGKTTGRTQDMARVALAKYMAQQYGTPQGASGGQ